MTSLVNNNTTTTMTSINNDNDTRRVHSILANMTADEYSERVLNFCATGTPIIPPSFDDEIIAPVAVVDTTTTTRTVRFASALEDTCYFDKTAPPAAIVKKVIVTVGDDEEEEEAAVVSVETVSPTKETTVHLYPDLSNGDSWMEPNNDPAIMLSSTSPRRYRKRVHFAPTLLSEIEIPNTDEDSAARIFGGSPSYFRRLYTSNSAYYYSFEGNTAFKAMLNDPDSSHDGAPRFIHPDDDCCCFAAAPPAVVNTMPSTSTFSLCRDERAVHFATVLEDIRYFDKTAPPAAGAVNNIVDDETNHADAIASWSCLTDSSFDEEDNSEAAAPPAVVVHDDDDSNSVDSVDSFDSFDEEDSDSVIAWMSSAVEDFAPPAVVVDNGDSNSVDSFDEDDSDSVIAWMSEAANDFTAPPAVIDIDTAPPAVIVDDGSFDDEDSDSVDSFDEEDSDSVIAWMSSAVEDFAPPAVVVDVPTALDDDTYLFSYNANWQEEVELDECDLIIDSFFSRSDTATADDDSSSASDEASHYFQEDDDDSLAYSECSSEEALDFNADILDTDDDVPPVVEFDLHYTQEEDLEVDDDTFDFDGRDDIDVAPPVVPVPPPLRRSARIAARNSCHVPPRRSARIAAKPSVNYKPFL